MIYKHAVLGETPELFKETAEWVHEELERIERNERAAGKVMESIQPLLDRKRENLISVQGQTKILQGIPEIKKQIFNRFEYKGYRF